MKVAPNILTQIKVFSFLAGFALFLPFFAGAALAETGSISDVASSVATETGEQDYQMTDAQFRGVLEQALRERDMIAAARDAGGLSSSLTADKEDEEIATQYRYEDKSKGTLFGVSLPPRTFNNIDYPY